jgi:hypothetical protein
LGGKLRVPRTAQKNMDGAVEWPLSLDQPNVSKIQPNQP